MEERNIVGFRFYPTEEELVGIFLKQKLNGKFDARIDRIIPVIGIYEYSPWDLPELSGERCRGDPQRQEWFFFIPGQEKEAKGGRPNRLTSTGYWKATGSRTYVYSSQNQIIGSKMTMVFYKGRTPGSKTNWKMNEYRAIDDCGHKFNIATSSEIGNLRTRMEFSICRVYVTTKCLRAFDRRPLSSSSSSGAIARMPRSSATLLLLAHHSHHDHDGHASPNNHVQDPITWSSHQNNPSLTAMERASVVVVEESPSSSDEQNAPPTHDDHDHQYDMINMNAHIDTMIDDGAPLWEWDDDFFLNLEGQQPY